MHHRALTTIEQGAGEVIEGALAALLFTAVAFESGLVVVGAPGADVVALTPRALEWTILPAQGMEVGLTGFGVEKLVQI